MKKLFYANLRVQKFKYLAGNRGVYTGGVDFGGEKTGHLPERSLSKTLPTKADLVSNN